jgi:hypothetical protein
MTNSGHDQVYDPSPDTARDRQKHCPSYQEEDSRPDQAQDRKRKSEHDWCHNQTNTDQREQHEKVHDILL